MRSLASSAERCPSTDSSPESGNRIDMIIRMHVVLPAPLGPMTPYSFPRGTVRVMSSTALVDPNDFLTSRNTSAESMNVSLGSGYLCVSDTVDAMRRVWVPVAAALVMASCGRSEAPAREYQLQGQILAVRPERSEVVIKHGDIKGFMPGMTMPFKVKDGALLQGKEAGDLVTATLVVAEVEAHLRTLEKTGHAPLDALPPPPPPDIRQ